MTFHISCNEQMYFPVLWVRHQLLKIVLSASMQTNNKTTKWNDFHIKCSKFSLHNSVPYPTAEPSRLLATTRCRWNCPSIRELVCNLKELLRLTRNLSGLLVSSSTTRQHFSIAGARLSKKSPQRPHQSCDPCPYLRLVGKHHDPAGITICLDT